MKELPREKITRLGPRYLEMYELLSIILTTGYKNESVFDISRRIMGDYSNKIESFKSVEHIVKLLNIPPVKASQICACIEIGRRIFDKNDNIFINSPKKIYELFKYLEGKDEYQFYLVLLNRENKLIKKELLFIGDNFDSISMKSLFKKILEVNVDRFIVVFNSRYEDIDPKLISLANNIKDSSIFLGLNLHDLISIKENGFISFKEKGII